MKIQRIETIRCAAHPNLLCLHLQTDDGLGVTLRPQFLAGQGVMRRVSA